MTNLQEILLKCLSKEHFPLNLFEKFTNDDWKNFIALLKGNMY
jgi:hypothetical protein